MDGDGGKGCWFVGTTESWSSMYIEGQLCVCESSMGRFQKKNKQAFIHSAVSVLLFHVCLFCAQFTHNTCCRKVASFSSRSNECMYRPRPRLIATHFLWKCQWYAPAFTKKMFPPTMNTVDKFGPNIFYHG